MSENEMSIEELYKQASPLLPEQYYRIPSNGNNFIVAFISDLSNLVHKANKKWWVDLNTGEPIQRNVGEMLCLVHSEISEALEGYRKNLMDDKLPHRPMIEVELADALIRILDISAGLKLDLGGAYVEKMAYNATRADHSDAERKKENGKKF